MGVMVDQVLTADLGLTALMESMALRDLRV